MPDVAALLSAALLPVRPAFTAFLLRGNEGATQQEYRNQPNGLFHILWTLLSGRALHAPLTRPRNRFARNALFCKSGSPCILIGSPPF